LYVSPILNHSTSLTTGPLFIAANQTKTFYGEYTIPAIYGKISMLQVAPHMHLIGRSMQSNAIAPGNINIPIIKINNWNFMWQGGYDFQQIQVIPVSTTLYFEAFYDNTLNNPFNPSSPPVNVAEGEATTDEMMMIYFTYTGYQPGDENIIIDSTLITNLNQPKKATENNISVYPNPVTTQEILFSAPEMEGKKCIVSLTDLTGRAVLNQEITVNKYNNQINLPLMNNGMYILLLKFDNTIYTQKINYQP
jgi:hypothetical protein